MIGTDCEVVFDPFHVMLVTWVFLLWLQVAHVQNGPEWPNAALGTKDERWDNHLCLAQEMCSQMQQRSQRSWRQPAPFTEPPRPGHHSLPLHCPWVKAPWKHQSPPHVWTPKSAAVSPLPAQCCRMPRAWQCCTTWLRLGYGVQIQRTREFGQCWIWAFGVALRPVACHRKKDILWV